MLTTRKGHCDVATFIEEHLGLAKSSPVDENPAKKGKPKFKQLDLSKCGILKVAPYKAFIAPIRPGVNVIYIR